MLGRLEDPGRRAVAAPRRGSCGRSVSARGQTVAEIGAGSGYFVRRLARAIVGRGAACMPSTPSRGCCRSWSRSFAAAGSGTSRRSSARTATRSCPERALRPGPRREHVPPLPGRAALPPAAAPAAPAGRPARQRRLPPPRDAGRPAGRAARRSRDASSGTRAGRASASSARRRSCPISTSGPGPSCPQHRVLISWVASRPISETPMTVQMTRSETTRHGPSRCRRIPTLREYYDAAIPARAS